MTLTTERTEPILAQDRCPVCRRSGVSEWGRAEDMYDVQIEHPIYRCGVCGHLYVHTPVTAEDLRKAYAGTEDSRFFDPLYYENRKKGPYTHGELWVLDHVGRHKNKRGRFLDVGSAQPRTLKEMMERGWDVTAVEPGAQGQSIAAQVGCNVQRRLLEDAEFPHTFDLISALDVLEHSLDPVKFLVSIAQALSPRGIALLRFPNSASLRRVVNRVRWEMIKPLGHLHFFSPHSFSSACRRAGLRLNHWCSRDVFRYCDLRLPYRVGSAIWRTRAIWDGVGWGDQMLVCVSKLGGSCTAFPSRGRLIRWKEPKVTEPLAMTDIHDTRRPMLLKATIHIHDARSDAMPTQRGVIDGCEQ